MTEKRNQRELLWFQTGGALNFITAAPHSRDAHAYKAHPLKLKKIQEKSVQCAAGLFGTC
jgi:hypothetical protein